MSQAIAHRQLVRRLLGSLAFVAVGALLIRTGALQIAGWIWVVFFGAAGVHWAWRIATGRPLIARLEREEARVVMEPGGFVVVTSRDRRFPVQWGRVRRVHAYKRDNLTTDEICVVFESDDTGSGALVSEERPGFQELFGAMERELGVSPAWYAEIQVPAFAPMHRVLFERADPATRLAGAQDRERAD
jgi:hypothetical protein